VFVLFRDNCTGDTGKAEVGEIVLKTHKGEHKYHLYFSAAIYTSYRGNDVIMESGQLQDKILKMFPDDKKVKRMIKLWKKYHIKNVYPGELRYLKLKLFLRELIGTFLSDMHKAIERGGLDDG
jgi:hypothetical protein